MQHITFITGNTGKFRGAQKIIPSLVQHIYDVPEIQSLDPHEVIRAKLETARGLANDAFVVEDTSLCIDALGGMPGTLVKWFENTVGVAGIADLTSKSGKDATAQARCVVGYLPENSNEPQYFEGVVAGAIVSPRGDNGFGWDSIFQPNRAYKTFAEMTDEEKSGYGMRTKAFIKLKEYIEK